MSRAALLALLVGWTLLAWSGAVVRGGFALDDREILTDNPLVRGDLPWSAVWVRDYWAQHPSGAAGQWRPLATASLRVDHALWGLDPRGYHATNVALHALVVVLASCVLAAAGERAVGPGLCLFALHPALADSVAWISGRTSSLSAAAGLAGCAWVARAARAPGRRGALATALGAAGATLGGAAGKEDGLLFGALAVLLAARGGRVRRRVALGGAAAGAGAWLALRSAALGSLALAMPHAPLGDAALGARLALGGAALARALLIAALPLDVPPALGPQELARVGPVPSACALVALLAALGAGAVAARRRGSRAGASLALAALACLPWVQIVPIGELFAPRFLYLPLLCAVPLVDRLARASARSWSARARRFGLVLAVAVSIPWAWSAVEPYRSRAHYWQARRASAGESAAVWNELGHARAEQGDEAGALAAWERAVALDPGYSRAWNNLGGTHLARGRLAEAEAHLRRAVAAGPRNALAWANLGNLLARSERAGEAVVAYERATALSPGAAVLWRGLARARRRAGRPVGALAALERALELDPADADARRWLGEWRAEARVSGD